MTKLLIRSLFLLSLLGWSRDLAGCQLNPSSTFADLTVASPDCHCASICSLITERSSSPQHHGSTILTLAETTEVAGKNQLVSLKKKVDRIGGPSWFYDGEAPGDPSIYVDLYAREIQSSSSRERFLLLRVLRI